jgi:cyanophycinase
VNHRMMRDANAPARVNQSRHPRTSALRRFCVPLAGALVALLGPSASAGTGAEPKAVPSVPAKEVRPTPGEEGSRPTPPALHMNIPGALVIVGGGGLPEAVRDRFLELAGGAKARLVVIPTASAQYDGSKMSRSYAFWQAQHVASVTLLHTLDPARANDPAFVKPLTEATGAWLTGGDQTRLTGAYHGTAVERELRRLLDRGGVIGGTSAGASAMSAVMITGGNPKAEVGTGFGFLPDVVIDQHFQNRQRLNRLLGVLTQHPRCLGVGIDEQTAVVVRGHTLTVLGKADVRLCLPPAGPEPASVQVLKAGQGADLVRLGETLLERVKAQVEKKPVAPMRASPAP